MMDTTTRLFLATLGLAVAVGACGSPPPPEEETAAPMPPADTGAGTILRVDPAFDALVPADAQIEKLADGFEFTEGPVWIRRGEGEPHLLFSDIPANAIKKWSPSEGVSDFMNPVYEGDPGSAPRSGPTACCSTPRVG